LWSDFVEQPRTLRVGTLNLRNTADRWNERANLLIEQLSELEPDALGLQELRRPSTQGWRIVTGARAKQPTRQRRIRLLRSQKTGVRRFWEGLAILTDLPVLESERLDLRYGNRVAQRALLRLPDGHVLDFYNTHLDHTPGHDHVRLDQVGRILDWMGQRSQLPQILVGDFNSLPGDPAIQLATQVLRSAFASVHGREPELTVPTPLSRSYGEPGTVIDFIFVNERVDLHDAWLTFDRVHPDDERLTASDHYGLAAVVSVRSLSGPLPVPPRTRDVLPIAVGSPSTQ
jgi:endonuclease/exonuclease/phosphatase family metal-dependent hydrolase